MFRPKSYDLQGVESLAITSREVKRLLFLHSQMLEKLKEFREDATTMRSDWDGSTLWWVRSVSIRLGKDDPLEFHPFTQKHFF